MDRDSVGSTDSAPASVGAGLGRGVQWLARLPRLWLRGWRLLGYSLGTEPHYLAGPSSWLARHELERRRTSRDRAGVDGAGVR
jgi:hypothetical protein